MAAGGIGRPRPWLAVASAERFTAAGDPTRTFAFGPPTAGTAPFRRPGPLFSGPGSKHSSTLKPARCGMADLVLTTFDWVPEAPRGYVRDQRVRWALEEAKLPYRVESVPFGTRTAKHLAHQPFGQ